MSGSGKPPTVNEGMWMDAIRRLNCVCCLRRGIFKPMEEAHHILEGGRRIGHGATLPLCRDCHQLPGGPASFHRRFKFTEFDLWNDTIGLVMGLLRR